MRMAAIRTVRESFRGDRSTILATSVALFGIVFALRLASPEAELGVTFLFVAPIVLVSLAYGARGAALGVAVAFGLTVLWAIVQHANLEPLGYLVRGIVFAFVGATSAIFRNQSRRLEEETTAWFEQALDLHCIADATGHFVRINEAFTRVLGHHKDEFLARPFIEFVHPEDRDRTIDETRKLSELGHDTVGFENRYRAKDGTYHWLRWSATPVRGGKIYASARDVTRQKQLEAELETLASTDPLTGLRNRRAFERDAGRTLDHIVRYGRRAAVLMIDLDGFKAVNDRLGHQAGDAVLVRVATALRTGVRSTDIVGRLGGDEFAVFLAETSEAEARLVADKLRQRVAACGWKRGETELPISGSVGLAAFDVTSGEGLNDLLDRADRAMFLAKRRGRALV